MEKIKNPLTDNQFEIIKDVLNGLKVELREFVRATTKEF